MHDLLPNFNPAEPQADGAVGGEGQDGLDLRYYIISNIINQCCGAGGDFLVGRSRLSREPIFWAFGKKSLVLVLNMTHYSVAEPK